MNDMEGFKVFISHSAEDSWVAQQIGRRIREDCGASTFLDVDDIAAGDNFMQRIHAELRQARELVYQRFRNGPTAGDATVRCGGCDGAGGRSYAH